MLIQTADYLAIDLATKRSRRTIVEAMPSSAPDTTYAVHPGWRLVVNELSFTS